jgi:hypothetical protein
MIDLTMLEDRPNGPVAAALIGGGLGAATLGLLTTLSESLKPVGDALNWWKPAGALTGKAGLAVAVFFISWLILHFVFREKNVNFARVAVLALVLLGLGLLGTFPPFFELFSGE